MPPAMSHVTLRQSYKSLSDRLNLFPQGAPPTELLFGILQLLFTEGGGGPGGAASLRPFTAAAAARNWKQAEGKALATLENLASRGMLLDVELGEERFFVLPPPMAGFFEFSMMRVGNGYDQKLLAELFYQYLNVEEDFVKDLLCSGETRLGRVFVNESALGAGTALEVMDYERASEVIRTSSHIGVGTCYCRHKMEHLNKACGNPLDICMTFHSTRTLLIKHGIARQVDVKGRHGPAAAVPGPQSRPVRRERPAEGRLHLQLLRLLLRSSAGRQAFRGPQPIATTNFLPEMVDRGNCNGCGKCVEACRWRPWASSPPEIRASPNASRRNSSRTSAWAAACVSAPVPERLVPPLS